VENIEQYILFNIQLPRMVLAFLVGGALSVSGVSFQSLLKNPLADPYILGVSGGAAVGYVLGIVVGVPTIVLPVFAFVFALLVLALLYKLACRDGVLSVLNLLLMGIVFNAFCFAIILVINSLVHFGQGQQIIYLLIGSLEAAPWSEIAVLAVVVLFAVIFLWLNASKLNLLCLGDEDAYHMGLAVDRTKKQLFVVTSLLVGVSVALCGLIGFVGLIVPHVVRLLLGADHRRLVPLSFVIGGIFLVLCNFLAGNLIEFENLYTRLPVGAVTALIGAPAFAWLLRTSKNI
jgi:iron complex transport system permease protein